MSLKTAVPVGDVEVKIDGAGGLLLHQHVPLFFSLKAYLRWVNIDFVLVIETAKALEENSEIERNDRTLTIRLVAPSDYNGPLAYRFTDVMNAGGIDCDIVVFINSINTSGRGTLRFLDFSVVGREAVNG